MKKRLWSVLLAGILSIGTLQTTGLTAAAEARAAGYAFDYAIQASDIRDDGNRYGVAKVYNYGDTAGNKDYWQILALAAYSNENKLNTSFWSYAGGTLRYGGTASDAIKRAFEKGDFTYADKLDNYVNRWTYGSRYNTAGYTTGHHNKGWHDALIMIPQLGMKYEYAFLKTSGKNGQSKYLFKYRDDYNYTGVCFVPGYAYDFVDPSEGKSYGTLYWFPARVNDGNYRYWGAGKNTNMRKYYHMTDYKTNSSFSDTFQVFELSDELYNLRDATGLQLSTRYVSGSYGRDAGAKVNLEEGYLSRRVCTPNIYLYTADGSTMEDAEYAALLNSIRPDIQLVKGKSGGDGRNGLYVGSTLRFAFSNAVYQPVILKASGSSQWGWNRNSSGLGTENATLEIIPEATGGAKASDISVYMVFERRQTVQLDERLAAGLGEKQITYTAVNSPTDYRQQAKDYNFDSKAGTWTLADFTGNAVNVTNLRTINFHLPDWEIRLDGQTYAGDETITIPTSLYQTRELKFEFVFCPSEETPVAVKMAPQVRNGLIYNGDEQQGVTEENGYTLSGHRAVDAGEYTATATLNEGYTWADGSTEARSYTWKIGKAFQNAPEGLTGQEPTAEGESDGLIQGTTEAMEYATDAAFSDAKDCGEGTTEGLAAGVYYVRYKEDANHYAGAPVMIQIGEGGEPANFVNLEVIGGSGGGSFLVGATVRVAAQAPGEGQVFSGWNGLEQVTLVSGSASDMEIEIQMPEGGVRLEAIYTAQQTYTVTVENGTGSGDYLPGSRVSVTADPPAEQCQVFDKWQLTEGTVKLIDETKTALGFEMKAENVTLTASYRYEHTFAWVIDKKATETETGLRHEECVLCGEEKEPEIIPATGGSTDPEQPENPDGPKDPETPEGPTDPEKPNPPEDQKPSGGGNGGTDNNGGSQADGNNNTTTTDTGTSGGSSGHHHHSGSSAQAAKPASAAQQTVSAKTGDTTPAGQWAALGGLSALFLAAVWYKRRKYYRK